MSVREYKSSLSSSIEYHQARLLALDSWEQVRQVLASDANPVASIAQLLGVTDLGAHAVIAMHRSPRPDRAEVAEHVEMLERLQRVEQNHASLRRRRTIARVTARHALA